MPSRQMLLATLFVIRMLSECVWVRYDPAKDHQKYPCDSRSIPRNGLHINYIINVSSWIHN
jgi:hypothetical protein